MEHGTIRNNEKYCDILAVNAGTHIDAYTIDPYYIPLVTLQSGVTHRNI